MGCRKSSLEKMVTLFNPNFWQGKSVFLTGHTGFKGSWLSLWLKNLGAKLIGYSLPPPTDPSLFELVGIADNMVSIQGDVLNFENLKSAIKKYKPEIVIHMAAQSLVRYSYNHPLETYMTNVIGTANILEAVRQTGGAKAVLIVTSDKCYENNEQVAGYKENDNMGGYDPYSSSKGCAELVTSAFRQSFFPRNNFEKHGTAVASARAGNVIGGGDWAQDRLIPDVVRGILSKQTIKIRNPNAVRPWQHVLEPLGGYLTLVEKLYNNGPQFAEAWNFGPKDSDDKSVAWVVERFLKIWGGNITWLSEEDKTLHEAAYLRLNCNKAQNCLSWEPHWGIENALEKTAEWYKAYKEKQNIQEVAILQIAQYEKGLAGISKS